MEQDTMDIVRNLKDIIADALQDVEGEDYPLAMEELAAYCESCAEARWEELGD